MKTRIALSFSLALGAFGCAARGSPALGSIAGQIFSATGLGTASQGEALFAAGGKIAEGWEGFSESEEYYLGRGVAATILGRYKPMRDQALVKYVSTVGATLAAHSDRPETYKGYRFAVLDTNEVNAMAAPSGFIFVTKGMIRQLPDEDALAAVLAHEIAHVVKGHGVAAVSQANFAAAGAILAKEGASMAMQGNQLLQLANVFEDSIEDVTETLLTKGYSKSQEYDADEYAIELMKRAGYNPNALVVMLSKLEAMDAGDDAGGWFSTHPDPDDRKDEIDGSIEHTGSEENQKRRQARFEKATKRLG